MRRVVRGAVVAALGALVLAGCAEDTTSSEGDGTTEASGCGNEVTIDELTDVGLAFDIGGRGDRAFNDLAVKGLEDAQAELGFEAQELSPNAEASNRAELLRQLADAGHNPIFGVGFAYGEDMDTVAAEYPDTQFIRIDGGPSECANVAVLTFAEHQGSYLVGVAAALKTQTNHVGFVGGNESTLIDKFYAGFKQGVESVDPSITIDEQRLAPGDDGSGFGDTTGGRVAAEAMYQNGADIVYHAAGLSGLGVFEAAANAGKLAIGVDADQYETVGDPRLQSVILTSMLKRVDSAVTEALVGIDENGTVESAELTLEEDGVGYSTSGGMVDDIVPQLEEAKEAILNGDVEVSPTP
ncbi:BMP family lipoprotein [Thalassiella azotivora]